MKNRIGKPWYPIAAALFVAGLLLTPCAVAADVNMQLVGAGPDNLAGVYVGPYTALINGVATPVICDDFADDTYIQEKWQAVEGDFSNLSGAKFGTNSLLYEQGAWLILQMLNPTNAGNIGAIQYALWELFDPSGAPFSYLESHGINPQADPADPATAQYWLSAALARGTGANAFTPDEFSNFVVYSVDPNSNTPLHAAARPVRPRHPRNSWS